MAQLLRDRYLARDELRGWDLATGETVRLDSPESSDQGGPWLTALVEVLEHGEEGRPRAVSTDVGSATAARLCARRAAAEGCARGYVSLSVEMYLRFRAVLEDELRDRTLLLIARADGVAIHAGHALLDAAARSPRPHILFTIRSASQTGVVREARASYGPPRSSRASLVVDADVAQHQRRAGRAAAFVREGRHMAAERLLREVTAALFRRGCTAHVAALQIELGRLLLERGRTADASAAFDQAATAAADAGDEATLADARTWQAAARTDAGRLTDAEAICRSVLTIPSLDSHRRAGAHAALARVLLWQQRIEEAVALDLAPDPGLELPVDQRAFVATVRVRVLLAGERIFEAGQEARRLVTDAASGSTLTQILAVTSHLRVLTAAGDLTLAASRLADVLSLCRQARTPLRAARARLVWAAALLRAGRIPEGRVVVARLQRLRGAAPVLLRGAVASLADDREPLRPSVSRMRAGSVCAARLVTMAHDDEDDDRAVRRVLDAVSPALGGVRLDVCSADAGPASIVLSVGTGLPASLGDRVIESGITLGPEAVAAGQELGVPLRRGLRLFAALVARWSADRQPPPDAREVLEITGAIVGPRVETMLARSRVAAASAAAVPELVGVSSLIGDVRSAIARAAAAPFSVMVEGESGVGKELVARAIHQLSARRERRFCDVNCAALPEELLESELFGHARGAFTGAVSDRPGLFEDADGGTVFLDELADLSARAQAKLLRVIQQNEVRRVGETFTRKVDVRLVTAANRDMADEVAAGRFRQDLLYRLDVIRIRIPPLRERPGDVPVLAQHFWQRAAVRVGTTAALTHGVLAALARYHWPGNVRELQNVMAALAVAAPSRGYVRASLLPAAITGAVSIRSARLTEARAEFERRAVESALARAAGSRTRAARELGLSRQGLLKMMGRLGLAVVAGRGEPPEQPATGQAASSTARAPGGG